MTEQLTAPSIDFEQFGPIERVRLSKIQQYTGAYLTRNWCTIPHVFHHDELDVTAIETERKRRRETAAVPSTLALIIKAAALTLAEHPKFNASLDANGLDLIVKKYVNIGVAVDTPRGLLVPVVRGCDTLSSLAIANAIAQVSTRAREKGLPIEAMSGGTFTVSSLGKLGGTGFTPIINAPEVAILGLAAMREHPVRKAIGECSWNEVEWRTVIPATLSYDHRVVNGVDAARFMERLKLLVTRPLDLL